MDRKKSSEFRILELYYSLNIIKDCTKLVYENKQYQMIPIWGQLRSLLYQPTKTGRNPQTPLLLSLINDLEIDIPFYYESMFSEDMVLRESVIFAYQKIVFSFVEKKGLKRILLKEYLNEVTFIDNKINYSFQNLFNTFSDKFGGSHYDLDVPSNYENLYPLKDKHLNFLNKQLLDFSQIILYCGAKIVETITNFHFFVVLEIGNFTDYPVSIFLLTNVNSNISLIIKNKSLSISMIDQIGNKFEVDLGVTMELNKRYSFRISHKTNNDLSSNIIVYMDKDIVLNCQTESLFFNNKTLGDLVHFNNLLDEGVDMKIYIYSLHSFSPNEDVDNVYDLIYKEKYSYSKPIKLSSKESKYFKKVKDCVNNEEVSI
jgi:hypothetical protein